MHCHFIMMLFCIVVKISLNMIGAPLSPEPEVKSAREAKESVSVLELFPVTHSVSALTSFSWM